MGQKKAAAAPAESEHHEPAPLESAMAASAAYDPAEPYEADKTAQAVLAALKDEKVFPHPSVRKLQDKWDRKHDAAAPTESEHHEPALRESSRQEHVQIAPQDTIAPQVLYTKREIMYTTRSAPKRQRSQSEPQGSVSNSTKRQRVDAMLTANVAGSLRPPACMAEIQYSTRSASKWRKSQYKPRDDSSGVVKKQRTATLSANTSMSKRRLCVEDIAVNKEPVSVITQEAARPTVYHKMPKTSMSTTTLSTSAESVTKGMLNIKGVLMEAQVKPNAAVSRPEHAKSPRMDTPTKKGKENILAIGTISGATGRSTGFPT